MVLPSCILNVPKIKRYLEGAGFDATENLIMMPGQHAAVLASILWTRRIATAIDNVANAAEEIGVDSHADVAKI